MTDEFLNKALEQLIDEEEALELLENSETERAALKHFVVECPRRLFASVTL